MKQISIFAPEKALRLFAPNAECAPKLVSGRGNQNGRKSISGQAGAHHQTRFGTAVFPF